MGEQTIESERARAEQGERDKGEKTTVENISSSVWNEAVVKAAQMGALAARSLVCVRVRTRDSATWDSLRFHCLRRPSRAHRFARLEGPACQGEAAAWTEVGLVTARVCRCSPLCRRQRPSVMCAVSVHAGELVCTCHACLRRSPLATVFSTPAALTAFYEINLSRSPLRPLAPSPKRAPSFPPSLPLSASLRAGKSAPRKAAGGRRAGAKAGAQGQEFVGQAVHKGDTAVTSVGVVGAVGRKRKAPAGGASGVGVKEDELGVGEAGIAAALGARQVRSRGVVRRKGAGD